MSNPTETRLDFYAPIHKAIRSFMADTLVRVGNMDTTDDAEVQATLAQLGALLGLMRSHLQHENTFVHPAIEARCQGGSMRIAHEHDEHRQALDALDAEARAVVAAPAAQRDLLALRLYRQLALFVAENLEHMHVEETVHNPLLWAAYTDEELNVVHDQLLASIPPQEMALALHWMAPSLSHAELAGMLAGMQAQMPPEHFRGVVGQVQPRLPVPRWDKLARALNLPQQPGLVHA